MSEQDANGQQESAQDDELRHLAAEIDEATKLVRFRHEVEQMQARNDALLAQLGRHGQSISQDSVTAVRVQIFIDMTLGDMDKPERLAYEYAVQTKFAELLAPMVAEAARSKLTEGVQGVNISDLRKQFPKG